MRLSLLLQSDSAGVRNHRPRKVWGMCKLRIERSKWREACLDAESAQWVIMLVSQ